MGLRLLAVMLASAGMISAQGMKKPNNLQLSTSESMTEPEKKH